MPKFLTSPCAHSPALVLRVDLNALLSIIVFQLVMGSVNNPHIFKQILIVLHCHWVQGLGLFGFPFMSFSLGWTSHSWFSKHRCNFRPEDRLEVMPEDMQTLLKQLKTKKKVVHEYDLLPVNKSTHAKVKRIGKMVGGNSTKRGCQHCFVAKKNLTLIHPCACSFTRTPCTPTHVVNVVMAQW